MSYHFLCKRGIRPARTEQFLVYLVRYSLHYKFCIYSSDRGVVRFAWCMSRGDLEEAHVTGWGSAIDIGLLLYLWVQHISFPCTVYTGRGGGGGVVETPKPHLDILSDPLPLWSAGHPCLHCIVMTVGSNHEGTGQLWPD